VRGLNEGSDQAAHAGQPGGSKWEAALPVAASTSRRAGRSSRAQAAIYPDWWPREAGAASSARRGQAKHRQQPRLAYSRPPAAPPSVIEDDLPTAAFLLVPPRLGSRAGGVQAGAVTPGRGVTSSRSCQVGVLPPLGACRPRQKVVEAPHGSMQAFA
jgi:hypothetical protein